MGHKIDELFAMVESLPIDVKTTLLEKILESLYPSQKEIDELWYTEVESRINDVKAGKVKLLSGDEVFQDIKERFSR